MKSRNMLIHPTGETYWERRAILDVRLDTVMKSLFFMDTNESMELLRHLLKTFVDGLDFKSVKMLNENEFNRNGIGQQMKLDGVCRVNDLHIIAVEMQKERKSTDFDRFTRYGCGLIEFRSQNRELYDGALNLVLVFLGYPVPKEFRNYQTPYLYTRNDQGNDVSKLFMLQVEVLARSAIGKLLRLPEKS